MLILTDKLLGLMAEKHITHKEMAYKIGVTPKTFGCKMKKGVFGSDEIDVIIKTLDIREPAKIFFA